MATNFTSATVAGGDQALASQYNNLRKDALQNGGDYATSGGAANAYILTIDAQIAAYAAGQIFKFKANFANTDAATLNVNAIGAKTIKKSNGNDLTQNDILNGQLVTVIYDGTNLQMVSTQGKIISKFGGDGSDGALSIAAGTTTINLGGARVFEKNYTNISITGTGSLAFSNPHANGTLIILRATGNVTITSNAAATVDVRAMGAAGGATTTVAGAGANGTNGLRTIIKTFPGTGGGTFGVAGAGTGGAAHSFFYTTPTTLSKYYETLIGGGGGAGNKGGSGGGTSGDGGAGGAGGASLIIECNGALDFGVNATIKADGQNGADGGTCTDDYRAGAGGGGAGGFVGVYYNILTTNAGTITVAGGTGGTSFQTNRVNTRYANGGGGGGCIAAGNNGTANDMSAATPYSVQTGGNGASGASLVAKNTEY